MPTKIPVFVSAPTNLSAEQQKTYDQLIDILDQENLERRALGRTDYPTQYPLKEVHMMARHCSGGLILGFHQLVVTNGIAKPGTPDERSVTNVKLPTAWNNLEAGILFGLRLPLMVFREEGISGGVFDVGVTDVFLNKLPLGGFSDSDMPQVRFAFQNWVSVVREHYRRWE